MNELKSMRIFVRCVERGSFSAVAREFETTQPNISKLVAALEKHLGGSLLVRATRGVRLTPQGQRYYEECKAIVEAVTRAEEGFGEVRDAIAGQVRISASVAFGRLQLLPHMAALMARYPELQVDLQLTDRVVDLVEEGVDIAFRIGHLKDSAMLARLVGASRRVTVASPAYIKKHGEPVLPADLAAHECIHFNAPGTTRVWSYLPAAVDTGKRQKNAPAQMARVTVRGRLQTNSPESVRQAALAGLGIAQISQWMVGADIRGKRLKPLLNDHVLAETPIFAVSLQSSRHVSRVRAVIDFYESVFQDDVFVQKPKNTVL